MNANQSICGNSAQHKLKAASAPWQMPNTKINRLSPDTSAPYIVEAMNYAYARLFLFPCRELKTATQVVAEKSIRITA
jgi:hypothetical protein